MMVSPTSTLPETSVPVITVPKPFMVNTRSIGRRNRPEGLRGGIRPAISSRAPINSGMPCPVAEDTGRIGEFSRKVPWLNSRISSRASSSHSSSTRSVLVMAIKPCWTSSRVQISMCSRVWGITPSSAAITMITMSMPVAPATIFLTNFSWPGTSTIPRCWPLGKSKRCKSKLDGDPALLFFFEPVRIDAGHRFYQAGFAVVDMSCRSENDLFHAC